MARGGRKKRRTEAADAGPSAAFLAALASQRENARLREQQQAEEQAEEEQRQEEEQPKELPGFYYDESKRRYFRRAAGDQRGIKVRLAPSRAAASAGSGYASVKSPRPTNGRRRGALRGSSSFQACLDRRQLSLAWSSTARDHRTLKPLLLGQHFEAQVLTRQSGMRMGLNRLTGLALQSEASNLGAIGYSNGRVGILATKMFDARTRSGVVGSTNSDERVKMRIKHAFKLHEVSVGASSWVSSLQWRPQLGLDLLFSVVGSSQSVGSTPTSFVGLLDASQLRGGRTNSPRWENWAFTDPWTASWNPYFPTGFSVGMGSGSCAAYVVPEIPGNRGITNAPHGQCQTPVVSQAFFRERESILNGTRSGSLWIWDLRAKRRAQELGGYHPSSVVDLKILRDDIRVVIQRSDGQLGLMDVRKYTQVLEFACGRPKTHLPMLRFAVDDDECVVVAAGSEAPQAVVSYNIQTGRPVASVHTVDYAASDDDIVAPVEQVHFLKGSPNNAHPGGPELWALSRSELFVCSSYFDSCE